MLAEHPFTDVKAGSQTNKSRMYFVNRDDAQKVLDACPDAQWKLLFALSRFGGLRCPSEHLKLEWADARPQPKDGAQRRRRLPVRPAVP
jgi:integrase